MKQKRILILLPAIRGDGSSACMFIWQTIGTLKLIMKYACLLVPGAVLRLTLLGAR